MKCSEESHNTLKFASRAKKIKMKAEVNDTVDDKTLLTQYREEIDALKAQLAQFQSGGVGPGVTGVVKEAVTEGEETLEEAEEEDTEQNQRLILQVRRWCRRREISTHDMFTLFSLCIA